MIHPKYVVTIFLAYILGGLGTLSFAQTSQFDPFFQVDPGNNEVERLYFDDETGEFVDRWQIMEREIQPLINQYILVGQEDEITLACHAFIENIHYIWIESQLVISPNGQQVEVETDSILVDDGVVYEVRVRDDAAIDECDRLVAWVDEQAAIVAGITKGAVVGSVIIGGVGVAIISDGGGSTSTPPVTPPPVDPPPVTPPPVDPPPVDPPPVDPPPVDPPPSSPF